MRMERPDGRVRVWVEVGNPSGERLHRASKAASRVVVFTYDADRIRQSLAGERIHQVERIELIFAPTALLDALGDVERGVRSNLEFRYVRGVERAHGLPEAGRQVRALCFVRRM